MCSGTTRIAETWIKLLVQRRKLRLWIDGHAQLCPPCRESWLEPFQLELWPDELVELQELPAAAPVMERLNHHPAGLSSPDDGFAGTPPLTASWPRRSRRAERDRRLSLLFG